MPKTNGDFHIFFNLNSRSEFLSYRVAKMTGKLTLDARFIGGDGRALDAYAVFLDCLRSVERDLIVRLITISVGKPFRQIIKDSESDLL